MRLHEQNDEFSDLISLTSDWIRIPEEAVKRDYFTVMLLQRLEKSRFADTCVFKGGTSLSKCYPGTISRFSEDIDLTYAPKAEIGNKQYDKDLKEIEETISAEFRLEKILNERNHRNKSSNVWFDESDRNGKIKLEIGTSTRPDPYSKKSLRTYIHEYLSKHNGDQAISEFELCDVSVNTLDITRTFLDKVMAVKRHAVCNNILAKVRHIYDVTMLFKRNEVQQFLSKTVALRDLLEETKKSDVFYLEKRHLSAEYTPNEPYDFQSWEHLLRDDAVRTEYEKLGETMVYTDEKLDFDEAIEAFTKINEIFTSIGE